MYLLRRVHEEGQLVGSKFPKFMQKSSCVNGSKAIKREAEGAVRKEMDKAVDDAEEVYLSVKRNDAAQAKDSGQCAKAHGKWEGGSCSRDPATAHKAMGKIKSRVTKQIEGKSPVIMTKAQQETYKQEVDCHIKRFEEHPAMDDEIRKGRRSR